MSQFSNPSDEELHKIAFKIAKEVIFDWEPEEYGVDDFDALGAAMVIKMKEAFSDIRDRMKPVTIAPLDEGELGELIKKQHPRLARMMPDPYVEVIFDAAKMAYRAAEARILKVSE